MWWLDTQSYMILPTIVTMIGTENLWRQISVVLKISEERIVANSVVCPLTTVDTIAEACGPDQLVCDPWSGL